MTTWVLWRVGLGPRRPRRIAVRRTIRGGARAKAVTMKGLRRDVILRGFGPYFVFSFYRAHIVHVNSRLNTTSYPATGDGRRAAIARPNGNAEAGTSAAGRRYAHCRVATRTRYLVAAASPPLTPHPPFSSSGRSPRGRSLRALRCCCPARRWWPAASRAARAPPARRRAHEG